MMGPGRAGQHLRAPYHHRARPDVCGSQSGPCLPCACPCAARAAAGMRRRPVHACGVHDTHAQAGAPKHCWTGRQCRGNMGVLAHPQTQGFLSRYWHWQGMTCALERRKSIVDAGVHARKLTLP